jgi:hypothetical protein
MKKLFVLFFIVVSVFLAAGTVKIPVSVNSFTGEAIPVSLGLSALLDMIGVDFDANWDSLRVIQDGKEIPYQIDDTDLTGRLSSGDTFSFLITGPAEIVVSDDFDIQAPAYEAVGSVVEEDGNWLVEVGDIRATVNAKGLVRVTGFGAVEGTIVDEIGIARVSGWVGSTFYVDGQYGRHEEKTSGDFQVIGVEVLPAGPVGVTVVSTLDGKPFLGLTQKDHHHDLQQRRHYLPQHLRVRHLHRSNETADYGDQTAHRHRRRYGAHTSGLQKTSLGRSTEYNPSRVLVGEKRYHVHRQ